jgi:hypothetical protein
VVRHYRQNGDRAQALDVCPVADAAIARSSLPPTLLCDGRHPLALCPAVPP